MAGLRKNSLLRGLPLAAAMFLAGCGDEAPSTDGNAAGESSTIERQITSGVPTEINFALAPHAQCLVKEAPSETTPVPLFADDTGVVSFDYLAEGDAGSHRQLELECEADGVTFARTLDIELTAEAVEPVRVVGTVNGRIRPALLAPDTLSDDELVAKDYPPRPGPLSSLEAREAWTRLVTTPAEFIEPRLSDAGRQFATARTSSNWSGFVFSKPAGTFRLVIGTFTVVPLLSTVAECATISKTEAASWVGIGGWGSSDIVQLGVDEMSNCWYSGTRSGYYSRVNSYRTWIELLPKEPQWITSFTVKPGDQIMTVAYAGDSDQTVNTAGRYGWFQFNNLTRGTYTKLSVSFPSGISLTGNSAEWVVERPTVGGQLSWLSRYGTQTFTNAYAYTSTGVLAGTSADPVTMKAGSRVLSQPSISGSNLNVTWKAYH